MITAKFNIGRAEIDEFSRNFLIEFICNLFHRTHKHKYHTEFVCFTRIYGLAVDVQNIIVSISWTDERKII